MKREKANETVKKLPNEFNLEELMEKLVFAEKVEKGLEQLEQGKTLSHEAVKDIVTKL
ncbi:hypothetical protein BH09BAC3_BH09BAC3_09300 [soil metagenome]